MNEILTHEMKLLGLVMPEGDEFCSYFTELPIHFKKCENFRELYRLKKYKRLDAKDNLEKFVGLDLIIHDQGAKKYFYKTLKEYSDMNKLLKYFKDGNLYILKDELRQKEDIEPEQMVIEEKNTNEDIELLF
jgi:hypothetical protein